MARIYCKWRHFLCLNNDMLSDVLKKDQANNLLRLKKNRCQASFLGPTQNRLDKQHWLSSSFFCFVFFFIIKFTSNNLLKWCLKNRLVIHSFQIGVEFFFFVILIITLWKVIYVLNMHLFFIKFTCEYSIKYLFYYYFYCQFFCIIFSN